MPTDRSFPAATAREAEVVNGWLDWQRATVVRKCKGLSEDDAAVRPIPASDMSVRGLVSHLGWVEEHWFQTSFLGEGPRPDEGTGWSTATSLGQALERYEHACERSREVLLHHEMDELEEFAPPGLPVVSLRWIATHVLEETARHLGHLDLLRESIDGARGY